MRKGMRWSVLEDELEDFKKVVAEKYWDHEMEVKETVPAEGQRCFHITLTKEVRSAEEPPDIIDLLVMEP